MITFSAVSENKVKGIPVKNYAATRLKLFVDWLLLPTIDGFRSTETSQLLILLYHAESLPSESGKSVGLWVTVAYSLTPPRSRVKEERQFHRKFRENPIRFGKFAAVALLTSSAVLFVAPTVSAAPAQSCAANICLEITRSGSGYALHAVAIPPFNGHFEFFTGDRSFDVNTRDSENIIDGSVTGPARLARQNVCVWQWLGTYVHSFGACEVAP